MQCGVREGGTNALHFMSWRRERTGWRKDSVERIRTMCCANGFVTRDDKDDPWLDSRMAFANNADGEGRF
jgi:hypothetical protein